MVQLWRVHHDSGGLHKNLHEREAGQAGPGWLYTIGILRDLYCAINNGIVADLIMPPPVAVTVTVAECGTAFAPAVIVKLMD